MAPGHWTSNAAISINQGTGWSTGEGPGLVANNTVLVHGDSPATAYGATHHSVIGNVCSGLAYGATLEPTSVGIVDYNVYWGRASDGGKIEFYDGQNVHGSLSSWQSRTGRDLHSVNADPKLNPNGTLQAGSPAIGRAPSQAAIFTDDFYGNQRTGTWDAGAFEFGGSSSGGGSAPTPTPGQTPTPTPGPTPTPASTPTPTPTLGGPVAAFGFNESSGSSVIDASGYANTGTITGATRVVDGKFGRALNFSGAGNLVRVDSSSPSLNLSSAMTLEAWVKPTADQSGWRAIVHREADCLFFAWELRGSIGSIATCCWRQLRRKGFFEGSGSERPNSE